jgi:hypothetical protein
VDGGVQALGAGRTGGFSARTAAPARHPGARPDNRGMPHAATPMIVAADAEGRAAIARTRQWLERAVIGLNLCPFAAGVHRTGRIRWVASPARRRAALAADLARELHALAAADPRVVETTLLLHPRVLLRFSDFQDFLGLADALLHDMGLAGTLQIAAFHPRWRFADAPSRDIAHASNRAPHPTLHLLREDSVARAVAAFPDAEAIYGSNIATLRALGADGLARVLAGRPPARALRS